MAVLALVLTTTENSLKSSQSATSTTSASRKLELIALLLPTSGVILINQFVISVFTFSTTANYDITGLQ